jgi:hypothetical protein
MGFNKSSQKSTNQSQQTSASLNQAFPVIQEKLTPQIDNVSKGSNAIADLLGLNGAQGQTDGFQKFFDSSGYNFIKEQGLSSLTGSNAVKGLLSSGSAIKKATEYGTNLASDYLSKYLSQLQSLSGTGLQSAQVVSGAGNTANSQGTSIGTSKSSSFGLSSG